MAPLYQHRPPPASKYRAHPPLTPRTSSKAPAPPASYTLSLHDALPICRLGFAYEPDPPLSLPHREPRIGRSEEHTSELQSRENIVCRLLREKKNAEGTLDAAKANTTEQRGAAQRALTVQLVLLARAVVL